MLHEESGCQRKKYLGHFDNAGILGFLIVELWALRDNV